MAQARKNADSRKNFFDKKQLDLSDAADNRPRLIFYVFFSSKLVLDGRKRAEATEQMMSWIAAGAVQAMQLVGGGGTAEQRCTGGE